VKVLHTPLTTSTEASKKNEGRIAVEYSELNPPTNEQLSKIEDLANSKIKERVPIQYFKMNRTEAEEKYKKNPVNETFIYDKFPVPPEITEVNIVEIPDWNINCSAGPLLTNTGDVKPISIKRTNHRVAKKELEFVFELVESEVAPQINLESKKLTKEKESNQKNNNNDSAITNTVEILDEIFAELKNQGIDVKGKEERIREIISPRIEQKLTILKNTAFANGFICTPSNLRTKIIQ